MGAGHDRAEVYRAHADDLTRFATGLVGPVDALDLVSNAVVRCLWSAQWDSVREPRAYLFRAVLNEARMMRRSNARRIRREAVVAGPLTGLRRASADADGDGRPEVLDAVLALSLRQRAVVMLTYWADMSPEAIGELLGISDGSVRRHLARARQHLREVLHA